MSCDSLFHKLIDVLKMNTCKNYYAYGMYVRI